MLTLCSSSSLDLIPIKKNAQGPPLAYEYDLGKSIRIPGAHGEEIVRDVFTDVHVSLRLLSLLSILTHVVRYLTFLNPIKY